MVIRTLIVDDEPIARRILREELDDFAEIEVIGEAETGAAALDCIASQRPDLVFLDLQMPVMGGFEVIHRLGRVSHLPAVIIVTAYDQYAIQALDAGAIDYLLKPVGQERLRLAVNRVRKVGPQSLEAAEQLGRLQEIAEHKTGPRHRKIVGRCGEEYVLLNASEVFAFQAEGDLVWIVTADAKKRYLATHTLRALQDRLRNTSFRRIHRNALVNLDQVRRMSAMSSQRWLVTLSNSQEFIVSKRQAHSVRELLSL